MILTILRWKNLQSCFPQPDCGEEIVQGKIHLKNMLMPGPKCKVKHVLEIINKEYDAITTT